MCIFSVDVEFAKGDCEYVYSICERASNIHDNISPNRRLAFCRDFALREQEGSDMTQKIARTLCDDVISLRAGLNSDVDYATMHGTNRKSSSLCLKHMRRSWCVLWCTPGIANKTQRKQEKSSSTWIFLHEFSLLMFCFHMHDSLNARDTRRVARIIRYKISHGFTSSLRSTMILGVDSHSTRLEANV